MAYTIPYTDQANKGTITIEDSTLNQDTSLKLPGRNTTAYGSAIAENFLHLLENFASATQPATPVEGQLWYDATPGVDQLKVYDGTNWVASGGLKKASTEPQAAQSLIGDLWVDTDNQQLYLYSGSGWVLVGPEFSDGLVTGISPKVLTGTDDSSYNILQIDVSSQPMAVVATNSFTPKIKIPGFTTIVPGVNSELPPTFKFLEIPIPPAVLIAPVLKLVLSVVSVFLIVPLDKIFPVTSNASSGATLFMPILKLLSTRNAVFNIPAFLTLKSTLLPAYMM